MPFGVKSKKSKPAPSLVKRLSVKNDSGAQLAAAVDLDLGRNLRHAHRHRDAQVTPVPRQCLSVVARRCGDYATSSLLFRELLVLGIKIFRLRIALLIFLKFILNIWLIELIDICEN